MPRDRPQSGAVAAATRRLASGHLPAADRQRADARQRLRDRRARLHDGVRHHPAHQLRARRSRDDRRDGRLHGHRRADRRQHRAAAGRRSCSPALLVAIPVCMAVGYTLERVAYRPLRRAPRLAPLITAIGLSIILQHLAMIIWSRNPLPYPQIVQTVSVSPDRQSRTARRSPTCRSRSSSARSR